MPDDLISPSSLILACCVAAGYNLVYTMCVYRISICQLQIL